MLRITLTKGLVGKNESQRKVVAALGLRKYGSSVVRPDSPTIRGMVDKVSHLVTVEKDGTGKSKEKQAKKAPHQKQD
jgi:large subunit ribosomal protein L30